MKQKILPYIEWTSRMLLFSLATSIAPAASSASPPPHWWYVEAGRSELGGSFSAAGVGWHLPWQWPSGAGQLKTRVEAHFGQWLMNRGEIDMWRSYQIAVVPLIRHTWQTELVPIFVEGGIGVSYFRNNLHTANKQMGTRWHFYDTLAIGAQLGTQKQYELSLRLVHQSNAGIRNPNPGLNSAQVRLAIAF